MNLEEKIKLLTDLKEQVEKLQYLDEAHLDELRRNTKMIIRNLFGDSSGYLKDLRNIMFHPMVYPASDRLMAEVWNFGK